MAKWKPTQAECDVIKAAARAATSAGVSFLEPGRRFNTMFAEVDDSLNIARVTSQADRFEDWSEDTDLMDHGTWAEFRKGIELTDDGVAIVDFYVQGREELLTNIVVYYKDGKISSIASVMGTELL